jgi:hypothetical protein
MAADKTAIVKAFDDVGARVEARTRSYYLLSYCSPSRAGKHEVRIEAVFRDAQKNESTGSLKSDFDATGFMPGCDPSTPPAFDVTKGDALAAAPPEEKKKEEKKDEKKEEKKETKPAPRPATAPAAQASPPPPATPPPPRPAAAPPPPPAQPDFNP